MRWRHQKRGRQQKQRDQPATASISVISVLEQILGVAKGLPGFDTGPAIQTLAGSNRFCRSTSCLLSTLE